MLIGAAVLAGAVLVRTPAIHELSETSSDLHLFCRLHLYSCERGSARRGCRQLRGGIQRIFLNARLLTPHMFLHNASFLIARATKRELIMSMSAPHVKCNEEMALQQLATTVLDLPLSGR